MRLTGPMLHALAVAAGAGLSILLVGACGSTTGQRVARGGRQSGAVKRVRAIGATADDRGRTELAALLTPVARKVRERYGTVQIAVMLDRWRRPLLIGNRLGSAMRLWSLSKPVLAVTLLRDRERRGAGTSDLEPYLQRALQRSDNCAMRELTIKLQDEVGGLAAARRAIEDDRQLDGATVDLRPLQSDRKGTVCISRSYRDLSPSYADRRALLLGTAVWTIADAVRFVEALQRGDFERGRGTGAGARVLALMRLPKKPSTEPSAGPLVVGPAWGAGEVFTSRCWDLAYKAGWGGAKSPTPWVASQVGTLGLDGGRHLAFAVAVHPYVQPSDDDPGHTEVPQAIDLVLGALRRALEGQGSCR